MNHRLRYARDTLIGDMQKAGYTVLLTIHEDRVIATGNCDGNVKTATAAGVGLFAELQAAALLHQEVFAAHEAKSPEASGGDRGS